MAAGTRATVRRDGLPDMLKRLSQLLPVVVTCAHAYPSMTRPLVNTGAVILGRIRCDCGATVQQTCARCCETFDVGWHTGPLGRCQLLGAGQLCRLTSPAKTSKCHDYQPGRIVEVK